VGSHKLAAWPITSVPSTIAKFEEKGQVNQKKEVKAATGSTGYQPAIGPLADPNRNRSFLDLGGRSTH
jgi:hypothetical protein